MSQTPVSQFGVNTSRRGKFAIVKVSHALVTSSSGFEFWPACKIAEAEDLQPVSIAKPQVFGSSLESHLPGISPSSSLSGFVGELVVSSISNIMARN